MKKLAYVILGTVAIISLAISATLLQLYLEAKNLGEKFIHPLGKLAEEIVNKKDFAGVWTPVLAGCFLLLAFLSVGLSVKLYRMPSNRIFPLAENPQEINIGIPQGYITIKLNDKTITLPHDMFFMIKGNNKNQNQFYSTQDLITQPLTNQSQDDNTNDDCMKINAFAKDFIPLQALKIQPNVTEDDGKECFLLQNPNINNGFYYLIKDRDKIVSCEKERYIWVDNKSVLKLDNLINNTNKHDANYTIKHGAGKNEREVNFTLIQNEKIFPSDKEIGEIKNQLSPQSTSLPSH